MKIAKILYLVAGMVLLGFVVSEIDLAEVADLIGDVGALGILCVTAIYLLAFLLDSISWQLILTSLPISFAWCRRLFAVRLAGEAFNNIIPAAGFGGEPVKALILKKRYGLGYIDVTASIVMARTINMIALIAFLILGFIFMSASDKFTEPVKAAATLGLVLLSVGTVLFFLIQRMKLSSRLAGRLSTQTWSRGVTGALKVIENMDQAFVAFYATHRERLGIALALAFANWVLGAVEIYVVFAMFGHALTWTEAWLIEAMTQMVRSAVFFIPLGIGAQEGTFVLIVGALTGNPTLGLASAAVRRIRELLWVILGIGAWAAYPVSAKELAKATDKQSLDQ